MKDHLIEEVRKTKEKIAKKNQYSTKKIMEYCNETAEKLGFKTTVYPKHWYKKVA